MAVDHNITYKKISYAFLIKISYNVYHPALHRTTFPELPVTQHLCHRKKVHFSSEVMTDDVLLGIMFWHLYHVAARIKNRGPKAGHAGKKK